MFEFLKKYQKADQGAVAIAFGMMVPMIVMAVGIAVDLAQGYMVRERLWRAIDTAALAAAATAKDGEVPATVQKYFDANFEDFKIGTPSGLTVNINNTDIEVSGSATVETLFVQIAGVNEMEVFAETVVSRQVRGLEVALVLDNTGSMLNYDNIGTLKTASKNFVKIMFERVSKPEYVRIGLVPYASSVNVGPYGLGENPDGTAYDTVFVNKPTNDRFANYGSPYGIPENQLEYDQSKKGQWHGCVLALPSPRDVRDDTGPWEMYRMHAFGTTRNWDYDRKLRNTKNWGPNDRCPVQPIVPLTSKKDVLDAAIDNMNAAGNTLGNYGAVWGYRVLTPEFPFTEGADWDDPNWEKAVLIMTDGIHTMHHAYSAYGATNSHNVRADDLDDKFEAVCTNMKNDNILVYTVTFTSGINENTKDIFRRCASDPNKYYDAPTQEKLEEVFEQIARELSNLYIKK